MLRTVATASAVLLMIGLLAAPAAAAEDVGEPPVEQTQDFCIYNPDPYDDGYVGCITFERCIPDPQCTKPI